MYNIIITSYHTYLDNAFNDSSYVYIYVWWWFVSCVCVPTILS